MNLSITKRQIGTSNKFLYEVFADGVKVGERRSPRTYVAAAVYCPGFTWNTYGPDPVTGARVVTGQRVQEDGVFGVASWIGREDLIMKNNEVKFGAKVARLVVTPKEYEK